MKREDYFINGHSLYEIRNYNEVEVVKILKKMLPEVPEFCGCSLCIEDVYALSLNMLPAKYIQASSILFPKDKLSVNEIEAVVKKAFDRVKENPSHSK